MDSDWARGRRYRFVLRGELGDQFGFLFEGMRLQRRAGMTVLTGQVADQAHLLGLIEPIQERAVTRGGATRALIVTDPGRIDSQTRLNRLLSLALLIVPIVCTFTATVLLVQLRPAAVSFARVESLISGSSSVGRDSGVLLGDC